MPRSRFSCFKNTSVKIIVIPFGDRTGPILIANQPEGEPGCGIKHGPFDFILVEKLLPFFQGALGDVAAFAIHYSQSLPVESIECREERKRQEILSAFVRRRQKI